MVARRPLRRTVEDRGVNVLSHACPLQADLVADQAQASCRHGNETFTLDTLLAARLRYTVSRKRSLLAKARRKVTEAMPRQHTGSPGQENVGTDDGPPE